MKTYKQLQEGVYDPNILKAFFFSFGPGSGKSYVVKRTTGGLGLKVVNSDVNFERLLTQAGLSLKMPDNETEPRDKVRDRAKSITQKQQDNYIMGRLGLIIDGTGAKYDKIEMQTRKLQQLGYDCHMVFVNTSIDVALQRNAERERTVNDKIVVDSWKNVQSNIGKFNNLFKSDMIIVDNNDAKEDVLNSVYKRIKALAKKKVKNTRGLAWIKMELAKKRR